MFQAATCPQGLVFGRVSSLEAALSRRPLSCPIDQPTDPFCHPIPHRLNLLLKRESVHRADLSCPAGWRPADSVLRAVRDGCSSWLIQDGPPTGWLEVEITGSVTVSPVLLFLLTPEAIAKFFKLTPLLLGGLITHPSLDQRGRSSTHPLKGPSPRQGALPSESRGEREKNSTLTRCVEAPQLKKR